MADAVGLDTVLAVLEYTLTLHKILCNVRVYAPGVRRTIPALLSVKTAGQRGALRQEEREGCL